MGVMHFQVSGSLSAEEAEGLRHAYIAGDYDHSPILSHAHLTGDRLTLRKDKDDSAYLAAPMLIEGVGRLLGNTATLMERPVPYRLWIEMARGKVNQVRSQMEEWKLAGLEVPEPIESQIRKATALFGQAVLDTDAAASERSAGESLSAAYRAADSLVTLYVEQVFAFRRGRNEQPLSLFGARLPGLLPDPAADAYQLAFNSVCVPLNWRDIETTESSYRWDAADAVIAWALDRQKAVIAGPLVDFSTYGLPDWLKTWEGDLPSLAGFMCDYIESVVNRYRGKIRRWVIASGANSARILRLNEEDLIRLSARLAEAAWGIEPNLEVLLGISQPWGEYRSRDYFEMSPFVFADTLLRAGLPLAGFELEWHFGTTPRGSWCRDPLEASRLLDMFALLGAPLQIAMSYPSSVDPDPLADPVQRVGERGWWHGMTPLAQAEWAEAFAGLALAKGNVNSVVWDHVRDAIPHRFPHAGLFDSKDDPKPVLDRLRILRENYLRAPSETLIV